MSMPELLAAMKAEIQTLEQFDRIGNAGRVAMKYGIDHADAHLYRKDLEKEAEELARRNSEEAKAKVAKMKAELTTVAEFKAVGTDKDVAAKYGIAESSAGRLLTELRQAEGIKGNSGWLKSRAERRGQAAVTAKPETVHKTEPIVTEKPEIVTEPKPTVLKTPETVHQVDNEIVPLKELEELFKEKPEPDLSKLDVNPVISEDSPLVMALEVIAKITEQVTTQMAAQQKTQASDNLKKFLKQFFAEARNNLVFNETHSAIQRLEIELKAEYLKELEHDAISAWGAM